MDDLTIALIVGSVLGAVNGVLKALDDILRPQPPPAQRRAMREDCRRKGL